MQPKGIRILLVIIVWVFICKVPIANTHSFNNKCTYSSPLPISSTCFYNYFNDDDNDDDCVFESRCCKELRTKVEPIVKILATNYLSLYLINPLIKDYKILDIPPPL